MIRFKSCSFHEEKSEKSKTARAVLGTLLKDTAYIYTFEVSFWGHRKNVFYLISLEQSAIIWILRFEKIGKVTTFNDLQSFHGGNQGRNNA
jgi:hypothetical protein